MLSPRAEEAISRRLAALERSDSTQVVVLTIPTLDGEDIESFALRAAHDTYHLGQKGKDNGVLLLVVRDDHKVRIEVGYGLEGKLTDLLAGRIIDDVMVPRFRAGDFEGGIAAGVVAIGQAVRGEFKASRSRGRRSGRGGDSLFGFLLLPALLGRAGLLPGLFGGLLAGPLMVLFLFPPFSLFKAAGAAVACAALGGVVGGLFGGRRGVGGMGLGYPGIGMFGGPRIGGGGGGGLGGGGFVCFSGGGGGFGGGGASGGW